VIAPSFRKKERRKEEAAVGGMKNEQAGLPALHPAKGRGPLQSHLHLSAQNSHK